jgi:hypothetical protein
MSLTTDHGVRTVQEKDGGFDYEIHVGKVLATRKNPHVTNAGSRPRF